MRYKFTTGFFWGLALITALMGIGYVCFEAFYLFKLSGPEFSEQLPQTLAQTLGVALTATVIVMVCLYRLSITQNSQTHQDETHG